MTEELLERLAISPMATMLPRIIGISPQPKSIIPTATDIVQTSITLGVPKALFQVANVDTGVIKWFNADLVTHIVPRV